MLASVHIENIALIKSLDINFNQGFSAFTGETGAGKSIVIDAIGMACGARVSKEIIRTGETEAKVEALFCDLSDRASKKCSELGIAPDEDGCIFVTRILNADAKNTVTANGKRIPLSLLREFAPTIINIHGQHDNADLLSDDKHVVILDSFASNTLEKNSYSDAHNSYCEIKKKISALSVDDKEKKRRIDILKYQIDEIKNAKLKPGEEEKLQAEKKKLLYSEKINKNSALCYNALYDCDNGYSAVENVQKAISCMSALSGIVDGADELAERLENVKYELIDIAETAADFSDNMSENPTAALDRIESRLDKISKLCSRYGADITEVLNFCEQCEKQLADTELSEENIKQLEKQLESEKKRMHECAEKLSESRRKAGQKLCDHIESELQYLDMKSAKFKVSFENLEEYTSQGNEKIEFQIKTNSGEGFHSLSKTASGGELSRVMLAIKSALSEKDGADTLIFDEIDTGISGSTSRKIGIKLKKLASKKQVFCVTHSAQVASLSDTHYKISKTSDSERTITNVSTLNYDEKVNEIARIISGMDISDASIKSAKELIDNTEE